MKKNFRHWVALAMGAASVLLSSCVYDPAYTSTTVSTTYGTGHGYGYGGSSFNSSLLISTGDSRWGYDPTCYSYYDYNRRAYYDPYLYGYYPVGYRPPVVYGVPHPHGWRPGSRYISPPSRVTNITVVNYSNRESAYRGTNYGWAKQVRQAPVSSARPQTSRPQSSPYTKESYRDKSYNDKSYRDKSYRESARPSSRPATREPQPKPSVRPNRVVNLSEPSYSRQSGRPPQEARPSSRNERQSPRNERQSEPAKQRPDKESREFKSPRF
jgi:hypothetical protein